MRSLDASVLDRTRSVVERVAGADRTPANSGPETPLGRGLWLDSIELLDVLVGCETEFGIVFDDVPSGMFDTLGTLSATIEAQLTGHREPARTTD